MLIETEILYTDEAERILGNSVSKSAPFLFELEDVSGIMPGDKDNKTSIIFLCGTDLIINLPFLPLIKKYKQVKKQESMQLSHEG